MRPLSTGVSPIARGTPSTTKRTSWPATCESMVVMVRISAGAPTLTRTLY